MVEDNDAASRGLSKILQAYGFDVTVVTTGTAAIAALQSGIPPDFVLTDLRLPDLDGREVARAAQQLDPTPRVALITGWDYDPSNSAAWGIDWFFPKPLNIQELIAELRRSPGGPRSLA